MNNFWFFLPKSTSGTTAKDMVLVMLPFAIVILIAGAIYGLSLFFHL